MGARDEFRDATEDGPPSASDDFRLVRTDRLVLRAVSMSELDVLYDLLSDPRVWTHLPTEVHTDRQKTAEQLERYCSAWERDGLGYWTAWGKDGTFVGIGGCSVRASLVWNLYYRLRPEQQGKGYAKELARAALAAAKRVRHDLPFVASLLAHNVASRAVAESVGLRLVWQGTDPDGPAAGLHRLLFADRELRKEEIAALVTH